MEKRLSSGITFISSYMRSKNIEKNNFLNAQDTEMVRQLTDFDRTHVWTFSGVAELPFGRGKTNPVATADVARVIAAVLADPKPHVGRIYELTGPRSQDMHGIAREFSDALKREITYCDVPAENWERALKALGLPEHVAAHVVTMGELHRVGRYDRLTDGVERVTGRTAMGVREWVSLHADAFGDRTENGEQEQSS